MKIRSKQYAQALYEALEGKDKDRAKTVIDNFVQLLARNRGISKINKILEHFDNIWNDNQGVTEARVVTSIELSKDTLEFLKEYISQAAQAQEVRINNEVDKDVLGGVVIRYGDKMIDASLRSQVRGLKNKLIK